MTNNYRSIKQLLFLALLTSIGTIGCSRSVESPNDEPKTAKTNTATSSKRDSSPETASPSEPVSAPKTSLTEAAVEGNVEAVRQHIAAGTNLNEQKPESGSTALIAAASFGKNETAILMIESGADLEVKNNEGSTALHIAAFLCREEIVKALLAKGADRNARNNAGSTPLDSVAGPFNEVKPIYDVLQEILGPYGLELDYDRIKATRPKMIEILRAE